MSAEGPEILWTREDSRGVWVVQTRVLPGGREETRDLFQLWGLAKVLCFDALRDARGTVHVAAVLHARDEATPVIARFDGSRLVLGEFESSPTTGGWESGDGFFYYPKPEAYDAVRVIATPRGDTYYTYPGWEKPAGRLDARGIADDSPEPIELSVLEVPASTGEGWSKVVGSEDDRWFIGVASGMLVGGPLRDLPTRAPWVVLDLNMLPSDISDEDAASSDTDVFVLFSSSEGVELRRAPKPDTRVRLPNVAVDVQKLREMRPGNAEAYAHYTLYPHSGPYLSARRVLEHDCSMPLSSAISVQFRSVLLPAPDALRVASPEEQGWLLEVYRFAPPIVGEPGQKLASETGRIVSTTAPECDDRQVSYVKPKRESTELLVLPEDALWVASDADGAFALVPETSGFRLDWFSWKKTPIVAETVARVRSDADPKTFTARRDSQGHVHAAYRVLGEGTVVYLRDGQETRRVKADEAAFAFVLDANEVPGWVVRQTSTLVYERLEPPWFRRTLGESDALPLAALIDEHGDLSSLLVTPSRDALFVSFPKGGGWKGQVWSICGSDRLKGAVFRAPQVVTLGCEE